MKKIARLAVAALLAACSAVTLVHAQEKPKGSESFFLGTPPQQVWSGRVREQGGQYSIVKPTKEYAQQMRKELASIQVSMDVDRKFDEARGKLDDLVVRATLRGYDDRAAVLVEIALARAALLQKLGKSSAALDAANSVLLPRYLAESVPMLEFTDANESDAKLDTAAAQDARLVALREKLTPAQSGPSQGAPNDKIDEIVKASLKGDKGALLQLGARAVPALVRHIHAGGLDQLPNKNEDPLHFLYLASQDAAVDFILANYDKGGDLWKTRILGCLVAEDAVVGPNMRNVTFSEEDGRSPTLRSPWLPVAERLFEERALMPEVLSFVAPLGRIDVLTPRLQKQFIAYLLGSDAAFTRAVLGEFPNLVGRPTATPIVEAGLSSPRPEVRGAAARLLLSLPIDEALRAAASNPDPEVRCAVATSLGRRRITVWMYKKASAYSSYDTTFEPPIGAPERDLMARLAADGDASVRLAAVNALLNFTVPLDVSVYDNLAKDTDRSIRAAVTAAPLLSPATRAQLANEFASDSNEATLKKLDTLLYRSIVGWPNMPQNTEFDPALWTAFRTRFGNKARPFDQNSSCNDVYQAIGKSSQGLRSLVKLALEADPQECMRNGNFTAAVLRILGSRVGTDAYRNRDAAELGIDFDAETWKQLFLSDFALPNGNGDSVTYTLVGLRDDYSQVFYPLAEDEHQSQRLRLRALQIASPKDPERTVDALGKLLSAQTWPKDQFFGSDAKALESIGATLTSASLSAKLVHILEDARVADWLVRQLINGLMKDKPLSDDVSEALLVRWRDGGFPANLPIEPALRTISERPRDKQGDWLVLATQQGQGQALLFAFRLLGDLRDPSYLDLLSKALNDVPPSGTSLWALDALTRYLDDSAAEIILKATGTVGNADLRQKCFEALDQIRKYQEEKSRWEGRKTSQQAKDEAVRQLVKLLDDGDAAVRAQAARSIATLGAVDQLPKLVTMLKDKDAGVRKAVQDALDALNAATVKKD